MEAPAMKCHKDSNVVAQTAATHRNLERIAATHRDLERTTAAHIDIEQTAATCDKEKIALILS